MTLTREALTDVAAIAAATPDAHVRLETPHGSAVVVADHPDGSMCVDGFRRLMAAWVDGMEPHVDSVEFVGGDYRGGVLATGGSRFFVTRLTAEQTADCLRAHGEFPDAAHATVRQDVLLDVTVVQVFSADLADDELEDATRLAQGACLVEELCRDVAAA